MKAYHHISEALIAGSALISVGIILLLNSLGYVSWDVWAELIKFWPVFIILAGLEILAGKHLIPNILVGLLGLLFIIGVCLYGIWRVDGHELSTPFSFFENLHISLNPEEQVNGNYQVETADHSDATALNFTLDVGPQSFTVTDAPNADNILTLSSKHYENFGEPVITASEANGVLDLGVKQETNDWVFGFFNEVSYTLNLGENDLSTNFVTTIGSGNGQITLENQKLTDLNMTVGSGSVTASLSKTSLPPEIDIIVGSGSATLTLPSDVGVEVSYEVGSGELKFGEDLEFDKYGIWKSPSYNFMDDKIKISVTIGSGEVNLLTK